MHLPRLPQLLAFFVGKEGDDAKIPDGLWEAEDLDEDGYISWDEFGGTKGLPVMTPVQRRQYLAEQEKLKKEQENAKEEQGAKGEQQQGAEGEHGHTTVKSEL